MKAGLAALPFFGLLAGIVLSAGQEADRARLSALLPPEILGWKAAGPDQVYDPETIFDYIDGAGEIYRAYHFKLLLSRRYEKTGAPAVVADIFDMGSAADAFGVFSFDLMGEDWKIGQGSRYNGGLLQLWRGRFFVALTADDESPAARSALAALGRAAAEAVGADGAPPDLPGLLPEGFRAPEGIRYLHSHVILNRFFFVNRDNVLALGPDVEVALGTKAEAGGRVFLLIARYPDAARAAAALAGFRKAVMPYAGSSGAYRAANGKWTAARSLRNHVLAVFDAPSASEARAVLEAAARGIGSPAGPRRPR